MSSGHMTVEETRIDKLERQNSALKAAYRIQGIELEMERHRGELLEERVDALRSQLPTYGSKVERWAQAQKRGEKACL